MAFLKAGVPDEGFGDYFQRGYAGELTPEAIKAEWAKLGAPNLATEDAERQRLERQLADETRRSDTIGSASAGAFSPDKEAAFEAERLAATTRPELIKVLEKYGKLADNLG